MKTMNDILRDVLNGYSPDHSANEYRLAAATVTGVYGPKGHKERRTFTAIVDLDYRPTVLAKDGGLMAIRCKSEFGFRFKTLPVVCVDFTKWDVHGKEGTYNHAVTETDSYAFENYMPKVLPDDDSNEVYDMTYLDDEMCEIIIQERLKGRTDECAEDIAERCREEYEAREHEEREMLEYTGYHPLELDDLYADHEAWEDGCLDTYYSEHSFSRIG